LFLEKFRQTSSIERVIEEERKINEEFLKRRHKENIETRNKFLESLNKIIDM